MTETRLTRTVETELSPEELWHLVGDGASWATWMVDEAAVEVAPGATGRVVDDGAERWVRIDHVTDGRLDFTWWPVGEPRMASTVELVVAPRDTGSALHITERFPTGTSASAMAAHSAAMAWDIRTLLLVLVAAAAPSLM